MKKKKKKRKKAPVMIDSSKLPLLSFQLLKSLSECGAEETSEEPSFPIAQLVHILTFLPM